LLKIRLRRTGAKKQPAYRLVVAEATAPRDGTFLEILGHYNPLTEPTTFVVKEDRVREWLKRGAQPTDRVVKLLAREGLVAAPVYAKPSGSESTAEAAPAAEVAAPTAATPATTPATATAEPDEETAAEEPADATDA